MAFVPAAVPDRASTARGLLRTEIGGSGVKDMADLFTDLRRWQRLEFIAEDPLHVTQAARLRLAEYEGHGSWELYRLSNQFFVIAGNCIYNTPRFEPVPGEGFVQFHLKLAGQLIIKVPGCSDSLVVTGPRVLIWNQPNGVNTHERIDAGVRERSVTLYCRPDFLRLILKRDSARPDRLLDGITTGAGSAWHVLKPLSPLCLHLARSLLHNPYRDTMCLLYAEAKALELLCEVLHEFLEGPLTLAKECGDRDERQLDIARALLTTQFKPAPRVADLARLAGMSKSKLKRSFKSHFGVTLFEYGLECRMHHALELLRSGKHSVSQTAYAVGYSHHTSFTEAFHSFFGFLPRDARTERTLSMGDEKLSGIHLQNS